MIDQVQNRLATEILILAPSIATFALLFAGILLGRRRHDECVYALSFGPAVVFWLLVAAEWIFLRPTATWHLPATTLFFAVGMPHAAIGTLLGGFWLARSWLQGKPPPDVCRVFVLLVLLGTFHCWQINSHA